VQQLLTDQLLELKIASDFSEVPMTAWINQDGCVIPVVAFQNWIMPKDCFVQMWFWILAEGKIYTNLFNHEAWSPILHDLNTHNQIPHSYKNKVLEWIFQKTYHKCNNWELRYKGAQFERVLTELQETAPG
jgi:uncharacterized membrane protein YbaN (DUF454 family)